MQNPNTGFQGDSNNDEFRSGYVQWLLHQKNKKEENKSKIPKVIIQFWDDLNMLPNDVSKCLDSWNSLKDIGFEIILFCDKSAEEFIKKEYASEYLLAYNRCPHPAMKCDYFRLCYLYIKGGAYVDADEIYLGENFQDYFKNDNLKIQPLCYDMSINKMIEVNDFFEDREYPKNRIFYVNNNPIISPSGHPLIGITLKNATLKLLSMPENVKFDIQSTTGLGNLTSSLVDYAIKLKDEDEKYDFEVVKNWNNISKCEWFLDYRNDERNWRNY